MSEKIKIEAFVQASPEKIWQYWTQPEHITQWNYASDDWCCPSAENDLRVGGKYVARMESKDGKMGFDFEAIYDAIDYPNTIAYTLTDGRAVINTFRQDGDKTHIQVQFDAESMNPREMQEAGWQMILNSFKKYTESH